MQPQEGLGSWGLVLCSAWLPLFSLAELLSGFGGFSSSPTPSLSRAPDSRRAFESRKGRKVERVDASTSGSPASRFPVSCGVCRKGLHSGFSKARSVPSSCRSPRSPAQHRPAQRRCSPVAVTWPHHPSSRHITLAPDSSMGRACVTGL